MGKTATKTATKTAARTATKLDRAEVVAAALDLVLREGPAALTMRRLATELDVGTPTIYWHAGSRDELVRAVVETQSARLADRPVSGRTPRRRVLAAALNIYTGAIEHRPVTSLANQTGTTSLLLHDLEAVLRAEVEAAGLAAEAAGEALRSLLVVVTGALVLTLRDYANVPEDGAEALWAGCDLEALTVETLRAVVAHHIPEPGNGSGEEPS
jgi:TetR/AcrR family transcriptional regulator, tetracycline repressor protein